MGSELSPVIVSAAQDDIAVTVDAGIVAVAYEIPEDVTRILVYFVRPMTLHRLHFMAQKRHHPVNKQQL